MITVTALCPTIPLSSHRLLDTLTLVALFAGPALAVAIQLWFERRRELRRSKFDVLSTLMAFRRRPIHTESVEALNRTPLVFHGDEDVLAKHGSLHTHMEYERTLPQAEKASAYEKRQDLLVELLSAMADAMGYRFSHSLLKTQAYLPQGYLDEETYTAQTRQLVTALLEGKTPLPVVITEQQRPKE